MIPASFSLFFCTGDGAACGANISFEQLQFVILNEGCEIVSPAFHYTIGLFSGPEDADSLKRNLEQLSLEMHGLEDNGLTHPVTSDHFHVRWYLSSDLKFIEVVHGLDPAKGPSPCPYCYAQVVFFPLIITSIFEVYLCFHLGFSALFVSIAGRPSCRQAQLQDGA
jgi:hypothetical protein